MNSVVPALTASTIVDTEMRVTFYLCPADYSNNLYVAVAPSSNLMLDVADNIVNL